MIFFTHWRSVCFRDYEVTFVIRLCIAMKYALVFHYIWKSHHMVCFQTFFIFQYLEDLKRNIQLSLGVGDDDSKVEQIQTYTTTS